MTKHERKEFSCMKHVVETLADLVRSLYEGGKCESKKGLLGLLDHEMGAWFRARDARFSEELKQAEETIHKAYNIGLECEDYWLIFKKVRKQHAKEEAGRQSRHHR